MFSPLSRLVLILILQIIAFDQIIQEKNCLMLQLTFIFFRTAQELALFNDLFSLKIINELSLRNQNVDELNLPFLK